MGAYGGTAQASIALHGWSLLTDVNNDGIVNFADTAMLIDRWRSAGEMLETDFDRDGTTGMQDFAFIAGEWLKEASWRN